MLSVGTKNDVVHQKGNVHISIIQQNIHAAKNLPRTKAVNETGWVKSNSIVPVLYSSAHNFIVIAGINMVKTSG